MDLGLEHKIVLITGGSKGIGLACAEGFAVEGARVVIASRSPDHLASAKASLEASGHHRVECFPADLGTPEAAKELVEHVESRVGPSTCSSTPPEQRAGTPPPTWTLKPGTRRWRQSIFPYMHAIQAVLPKMVGRKRGVIVSVVGQGGKVAGPNHLPGGAANAAVMLATAGLAAAHARDGIRVLAINPGTTLTDRARGAFEAEARRSGISDTEARRSAEERIPLGAICATQRGGLRRGLHGLGPSKLRHWCQHLDGWRRRGHGRLVSPAPHWDWATARMIGLRVGESRPANPGPSDSCRRPNDLPRIRG